MGDIGRKTDTCKLHKAVRTLHPYPKVYPVMKTKINSHRKIDRNPRFPRQRKSKRGFENGKRAVEKLLVRRRENIRIELTKQEGARFLR